MLQSVLKADRDIRLTGSRMRVGTTGLEAAFGEDALKAHAHDELGVSEVKAALPIRQLPWGWRRL